MMKEINQKKNEECLEELGQAVSSGRFLTDYNEIWEAVKAGRGNT